MEARTPVRIEHHGPVRAIVLDRPDRLNALDREMGEALSAAIGLVERDEAAKVVMLRGAGRAFCAGGDVAAMARGISAGESEATLREIAAAVHKVVIELTRLPIPIVCAVQGPAFGAGFSLALACDFVIAASDARFCQAFARLGASPDSGSTYFLPRLVGRHVANQIVMLGEEVSAEEGSRLGFVNQVVEGSDLEEAAADLSRRLADGPARALELSKRLIQSGLHQSLERQLEDERYALGRSASTEDFAEGVGAFIAKRAARFDQSAS